VRQPAAVADSWSAALNESAAAGQGTCQLVEMFVIVLRDESHPVVKSHPAIEQ